jgi:outer membrane biosynthesis protein TonB
VHEVQRIDEKRIWLTSSIGVLFFHIVLIFSLFWINSATIERLPPTRLRVHMSGQQAANTSIKEAVSTSSKTGAQKTAVTQKTAVESTPAPTKASSQKANPIKASEKAPVAAASTVAKKAAEPIAPKPTVKPNKPDVKAATPPVVKTTPTTSATKIESQTNQAKVTAQAQAKQRLLAQVQQALTDSKLVDTSQTNAVAKSSHTSDDNALATWSSPIELPSASISAREKASNYDDILSTYLRQTVVLPEHGTVEVSLTLDREGHIVKCRIIEANSMRNSTYVTDTLPQLQLPAWPKYLGEITEYTVCCKLTTHF